MENVCVSFGHEGPYRKSFLFLSADLRYLPNAYGWSNILPNRTWSFKLDRLTLIAYCRVPEGRGLHKTARPPGHDETWYINPLVCTQVDYVLTDFDLTKWIRLTNYSRVPLMWTPKGRAKSVHISEPSTVVDTLCCGHIIISQAMPN